MPVGVHYLLRKEEGQCANCRQPATSVINNVPQCNEHAGLQIINEFPEVLGDLLAQKLKTG
jgi:hypothetical protein